MAESSGGIIEEYMGICPNTFNTTLEEIAEVYEQSSAEPLKKHLLKMRENGAFISL